MKPGTVKVADIIMPVRGPEYPAHIIAVIIHRQNEKVRSFAFAGHADFRELLPTLQIT